MDLYHERMQVKTSLFMFQSKLNHCMTFNLVHGLIHWKFVFLCSIEGEYVPRENDEVSFRMCPIPPKSEKFQAIHVRIVNFTPDVHLKWDSPIESEEVEKSE